MQRNAIVLVIDRLGAGHPGPYGNTLFATPGFNRLADTAWLCERAITDSPDLATVYRSWLTGRHALCPAAAGAPGLCERLSALGVESSLFTDDAQVSELTHQSGFGRHDELPTPSPEVPANEIAETQLAAFFGELIELAEQCPPSHLLWAHSRGLAGPWDAPLALRELLVAEGDPPPLAGVETPSQVWTREEDFDQRWPLMCTHAAQVMVVDTCLEALLGALPPGGQGRETLLIVTSPRGFPLGEHGGVGEAMTGLHAELLHVPLFVRLPDGIGAAGREAILSQPADLPATLLAFFGGELPGGGGGRTLLPRIAGEEGEGQKQADHERAVAVGKGQAVIHTPHWCWHGEPAGSGEDPSTSFSVPSGKLFVKPDDRWEVNEIADRCLDVAESMQAELMQFAELASQVRLDELPPLSSELTEMLD